MDRTREDTKTIHKTDRTREDTIELYITHGYRTREDTRTTIVLQTNNKK